MSNLLQQVAGPLIHSKRNRVYGRCACGSNIYNQGSIRCRECFLAQRRSPVDPREYVVDGIKIRRLPLTRGRYALVNTRNYDFLVQIKWRPQPTSTRLGWYSRADVRIGDKETVNVYLHLAIFGPIPDGMFVDHRDRLTLNCTEENLRMASVSQSMANRGVYDAAPASGFRGVRRVKAKHVIRWSARIRFLGEEIWLGSFSTPHGAAIAYDKAAVRYYGEFAVLNFPLTPPTEMSLLYYSLTGTTQKALKHERPPATT